MDRWEKERSTVREKKKKKYEAAETGFRSAKVRPSPLPISPYS
jgi:hypothetical protein